MLDRDVGPTSHPPASRIVCCLGATRGHGESVKASASAAAPLELRPMLATLAHTVPTDAGWAYEMKWDGVARARARAARSASA